MKNCPEQFELYTFVDGELPRERWEQIDQHLPQCSRCRDEIRGIARLNRQLNFHEPVSLPDDFEQSFRTALLSRTITSNEVRTFRRILETKRLVSLAAGFVIAVVVWQLVPRVKGSFDGLTESEVVSDLNPIASSNLAQLTFDRFVASAAAMNVEPDEARLRELRSEFVRGGESLTGHILSRFESATPAEEKVLCRVLTETKNRQSQSLLTTRLRKHAPRSPMRRFILESMVEFPNEETARLIGRESRNGLSFAVAFDLLSQLPRHCSWDVLLDLCERNLKVNPKQVVELLAAMNDERAESYLLDLHLRGIQSAGLTAHLVSRERIIKRTREIVSTGKSPVDERRLAIHLLGEKGDLASGPMLANLVDDPSLGHAAVMALAKLGTEDAMTQVIHRLPLTNDRSLSAKTRKEQAVAEDAIRGLGDAGLKLVIRLVQIENHKNRRHYVEALGILGNEETLPLIYTLVKTAELREVALRAVLRIASPTSREFLLEMSRDRNHKIRRLARRGLKKLKEAAPAKKPWRGFA